MKIPFGKPLIGDEEKSAVLDVLNGPILVHGPKAKEFEADFSKWVGGGRAVSVSSCTAALHLSYFHLGIGEGDEVIVPAQTHVATAHAVELTGAKPIFVDAELQTGNINIDEVEEKITKRTRALSLVHFLGYPVNMGRLRAIAERHNLFVVEDCALAIGTYYKGVHAGLHGDVGCFSFYPVKHMTTAEGGMLLTKHSKIADQFERQRAFGVDRHIGERKVPGEYDVTLLGFNYRLNEIQAAIGIQQIKKLNSFLQARNRNYKTMAKKLREITEISLFQDSTEEYQSSHYCLSALLHPSVAPKRTEIVSYLTECGVGTSVYYPHPVPCLQYYREKYGYQSEKFPAASRISYASIALPVGPHLNEDQMDEISTRLKEAIKRVQ